LAPEQHPVVRREAERAFYGEDLYADELSCQGVANEEFGKDRIGDGDMAIDPCRGTQQIRPADCELLGIHVAFGSPVLDQQAAVELAQCRNIRLVVIVERDTSTAAREAGDSTGERIGARGVMVFQLEA